MYIRIIRFIFFSLVQMYSSCAKIVKPAGEKPDNFESKISEVSVFLDTNRIDFSM